MIIREGRNGNNGNNVKRELCDKRFCYMLIQNWLQLSKLHQSGSQGKQFTPAGSHEETSMEILGTEVWAGIKKDKRQGGAWVATLWNPYQPSGWRDKGPGEEGGWFTKAQVIARAGYWGREEWGRKDPTSISPHAPLPWQCLPLDASTVKPAGKGGLWCWPQRWASQGTERSWPCVDWSRPTVCTWRINLYNNQLSYSEHVYFLWF